MHMDQDLTRTFCAQVRQAYDQGMPIRIQGGNSKSFYGRPVNGDALLTTEHCGVISYEPSELVLRARTGTRLSDLEQLLDEQKQMLAFEPPHFGENDTLGGAARRGRWQSHRPALRISYPERRPGRTRVAPHGR